MKKEEQTTQEDLLAALKQLVEQASALMDHCVDKSFIDPEDETDGLIDFNKAIEQANKAIALAEKGEKSNG